MRVQRLTLTNLRAVDAAELSFVPGFNLLVGINGVGKSTVLDAIRIALSRVLPLITDSKVRPISFTADDISHGRPLLDVVLAFEFGGQEFRLTRLQWREDLAKEDEANLVLLRREILESTRLRDRPRRLLRELEESQSLDDSDFLAPSDQELKVRARKVRTRPNCIFFSTNRSVIGSSAASKGKAVGKTAAAYAEALTPRTWDVREFTDWLRVQATLASEIPQAARHLKVLQNAAIRFLPEYRNIHFSNDKPSRLLIEKGTIVLDVQQLSDGERGILAMVLDLARRLSQANPQLNDPLRQGEAIILIDELDLHLHPKWQRTIVDQLTNTFPRCQFIATTHSPQVVAAVEPEQVLLLTAKEVIRPDRTLGMDSNWILRHLMETDDRPSSAAETIRQIESSIKTGEFDKAYKEIATARASGLNLPEWSILEARIARLQILSK